MSEHQTETSGEDINLGVSSRTDVGGTTGTQPDAAGVGDAPSPQQTVTQGDPSGPAAPATANAAGETKPGVALGDTAPKVDQLQNQLCPNCHTGVLYVTRYDPFALHERGQSEAFNPDRASGGAYDVSCYACNFSESRAFNPANGQGR